MTKYWQPDEVMGLWDNGGETLDRYSIHLFYTTEEDSYEELICTNWCLSIFSRAEQFDTGEHLGKEIDWKDLPEELQAYLIMEVEGTVKQLNGERV